MKFSQNPPTEPGIYWYKLLEDSGIHHCYVWRQNWPGSKGLVASASEVSKPVEEFARWWSDEFLREPIELCHPIEQTRTRKK